MIVTTDGSTDLLSVAQYEDVWIVDTPANRPIAESLWKIARSAGLHEITTFKADDSKTADQWVAGMLSVLHDHHDLDADSLTLTVVGTGPTDRLRAALAEFGPLDIVETPGGFVARRDPDASSGQAFF